MELPPQVSSLRGKTVYVKVLVRWVKGKRFTDRLPNLSLTYNTFPPWNGPDIRVYAGHQQHAAPISGDPEVFFRLLGMRKLTVLQKAISWWT